MEPWHAPSRGEIEHGEKRKKKTGEGGVMGETEGKTWRGRIRKRKRKMAIGIEWANHFFWWHVIYKLKEEQKRIKILIYNIV